MDAPSEHITSTQVIDKSKHDVDPSFKGCANPGCQAEGTKKCAACKNVSYCSKECQKANWTEHKSQCSPKPSASPNDLVECVKIYGGPGGRYETVHLPRSDEIFRSPPLPITRKFKYPLVIKRLHDRLPRGTETDNQHATWLMIDPVSGFAPPAWQGGIGHVYVARANFSPLTTDVLGAIVDYVSRILDQFGENKPNIQQFYDRARLGRFLASHKRDMEESQRIMEKYNQNPDKFFSSND